MKDKLISIACAIVLTILNVCLLFCNFMLFHFVLSYIENGDICRRVFLGFFFLFLLVYSALVIFATCDILKDDWL